MKLTETNPLTQVCAFQLQPSIGFSYKTKSYPNQLKKTKQKIEQESIDIWAAARADKIKKKNNVWTKKKKTHTQSEERIGKNIRKNGRHIIE